MESNDGTADLQGLGRMLDEAEASAARWAGSLRLPTFFYTSLGVAVAVHVFTAAWGLASDEATALPALGFGLALFAAVAAIQLLRFRRLNGAWVAGLASRVVLGSASAASAAEVLSLGGAVWAGFEGRWWLSAVCAGLGGAGYALSGLHWWRRYQRAPGTLANAESLAWLVAVGSLAVAGAVLLLVAR